MTLKEVARLANVSASAVSRYLNGGSLSEEKKSAIRAVIEQTGFRPNPLAHTLRTGRVQQVGVIVPRIQSTAVSHVTEGINSVLSPEGYLLVICSAGGELMQEARYLEMMQSYRMAGVIVMATSVTEEKHALYRACRIPLVVTGQRFADLDCVWHDDFGAMHALTARMIAGGRRRIGYIGVSESDPAVGTQRRLGAQAAVREAGLDAENMLLETAEFRMDSGREAMLRMLGRAQAPDGVVCATDVIAHGAMLALREAGLRIPQDVGVAGVGGDRADLISSPQLSVAQLYQADCGRSAAQLLLQRLKPGAQPGSVRQMCLGYTIIERESF